MCGVYAMCCHTYMHAYVYNIHTCIICMYNVLLNRWYWIGLKWYRLRFAHKHNDWNYTTVGHNGIICTCYETFLNGKKRRPYGSEWHALLFISMMTHINTDVDRCVTVCDACVCECMCERQTNHYTNTCIPKKKKSRSISNVDTDTNALAYVYAAYACVFVMFMYTKDSSVRVNNSL